MGVGELVRRIEADRDPALPAEYRRRAGLPDGPPRRGGAVESHDPEHSIAGE